MQEKEEFDFTQPQPKARLDLEFKKQRQAYLKERLNHKKQAKILLKRERGSSSSEDEVPHPIIHIKPVEPNDGSNTDSSKNSPSSFQKQRQRYKQERLGRKQEALKIKRKEFGSSSSDDEQLHLKQRISPNKPEISPKQVSNSPFKLGEPEGLQFLELESDKIKEPKYPVLTAKLKSDNGDKKASRERYQVEVPSKKGVNIWLQKYLEFKENAIELAELQFAIYDITKIKMLLQRTQSGCLKLKVTSRNVDIFFAVNPFKLQESHFLDHYYFIFAKIVSMKLQLMGRKPINSNKAHFELNEKIIKGARLCGKVRKSSFFGGWEEKIGVVDDCGLSLYKENKDKPILTVSTGNISEIWTRFQLQSQNLIVKFRNGSSKVELSVPIQNYLSRQNWLYQLYTLSK